MHFMFGSRVGFSGLTDRMALFLVTSNLIWRQAAILDNFEWPYLHNDSLDPLCDSTTFLFLFTAAAACYIRLHGWGSPPGPEHFYAVETNGIQHVNMTPGPHDHRGFHSYVVDASTCLVSDYQYWDTHESSSESPRLINYLQALNNGK